MMPWRWFFIPLTGAIIGWATNVLAIKMLFHPRHPIRIFGLTVQGLLPKRRLELARTIGETVERDLLPLDHLLDQWETGGFKDEVVRSVVHHVGLRLDDRIPRLIPAHVRLALVAYAKDVVERETLLLLDQVAARMKGRLKEEIQVSKLVAEKVAGLNLDDLERLIMRVSEGELRHIEILGGVLGFLIGLTQVIFLELWS